MRIKLTIALLSIFVTIAAILTGCDSSKQKSKLPGSGQKEDIVTWLEKHKSDDSTYRERLFSVWDNEKKIDTAFYLLIEKYGRFLNVKSKQDSEFTSRLINTLPKVNSPKISHSFLNIIGGQYVTAGLPDSALHFYQIAVKRFASSGHDSLMENTYMGKGQVFYGKASYEEALGEYKKALRHSSKLPEEGNKWTIIGYIGNVYLDLNENQKAADYYKLAADAMIREKNFSKAIVNYSSLTNVYSKMSDSLNGFKTSNRALFLIDSIKGDPYSSFTVFYSRANLLKRFGKLDQAIEMYDKCINEQKKLNNEYLAKRLELYKVEVYAKTKKWNQAKSILTGLLPIAKKMNGDPSFLMDVYGQLARVENADGNYKESLNNFSNYYRIKDSIDIRKQTLEIARLDKEFQTKEKDLQIKLKSEQLKVLEKERNMWTAITVLAVFIAGAGIYFLFVRRKQLLKKREAELNEKYHQDLIAATESEQARIALDLHDGVASELLVLKASLNTEQPSHTKKQIDEIIQDIRMLTKKLYPVQLKKIGLCTATLDLIQQLDRENDVFFSTEIDESLNNILSEEKQLYLFRIIQEALMNILKHSEAQAAFVGISGNHKVINLTIKDNGKGFQWPIPEELHLGTLGLLSIHHRAGIIGATLNLTSAPGEGTTLQLTIPVL